jgi:hypothetical protein
MSKRFLRVSIAAGLCAALLAALLRLSVVPALAHGHVEVGDYELVIGFANEPAFQGEPNGLDLIVTNHMTGEPVAGLDTSLRAEIIFGSSRRELALRPQFGEEGAYTADILPTEAGDYTWRIYGAIEETPVDISMTSGPETFSSVEAKSAASFPEAEPSTGDLTASVAAAENSARTALLVAVLGALLGLAGLAAGLFGLQAARRRAA